MDQKYNISEILDAVDELNNSKSIKKINNQAFQESKKISREDIPPNTLKLIEEAEKNISDPSSDATGFYKEEEANA